MTNEQAQKLLLLHKQAYIINISTHYVDSCVEDIYIDDCGLIVYNSEVYSGRKLCDVNVNTVTVSKPINWLEA